MQRLDACIVSDAKLSSMKFQEAWHVFVNLVILNLETREGKGFFYGQQCSYSRHDCGQYMH